ncbi:MAG: hypothetical protein WBC65_16955 [Ignavibacteria bacterium]|jgi:hypothetical protein|nr:hypothetical protein [Ignavibacteria bacterium]
MKPHEIKRDSPQNIRKIAEYHLKNNLKMLDREFNEQQRKEYLDRAETTGWQEFQDEKNRLMKAGESETWAEHEAWRVKAPMYITPDPAAYEEDEEESEEEEWW